MKFLGSSQKKSAGFTLLEVIITLGILTSMIIAISTLLRSSFDVRFALSQEGIITHRLNTAMQKISADLSHAFILSSTNLRRNAPERTTKTIFTIDRSSSGDKIGFTMMNHAAVKYNARESDSAYVVYMLKDAKDTPGRKHLYRGVYGKIPSNFKEDPPMKLLAKHIKSIEFQPWKGDDWSKDKWSSKRRETRDKIPHLIKISIEAWVEDPVDDEQLTEIHELTTNYHSISYLPYASKFKELKSKSGTLKL